MSKNKFPYSNKEGEKIQITPTIKLQKLNSTFLPKGESVRGFPLSTLIEKIQKLDDGFYEINETNLRIEVSKKEASLFFPSNQMTRLMIFFEELIDYQTSNEYADANECNMCYGEGCFYCEFN